MADVPSTDFGLELKDAFKPVEAWASNGIRWLDDIQSFYRERSIIEREYSQKLSALSKKYLEKKAKKSASLSVGDTPAITPGSLESASLTTWTTILDDTENLSRERGMLADSFNAQIADPLKNLALKCEDLRKKHVDFATKLEEERDKVYADLTKTKKEYDAKCQTLESKRSKSERAYDMDKSRAQSSYDKHLHEANNAKNTYLVKISVANRHKAKYYHQDIPMLLNSLQDLSELRTHKLNILWTHASTLEQTCLARSTGILQHTAAEVSRNVPILDSTMFVRHNQGPWNEPVEFAFEPSPIWHDDPEIVTDEHAKVFLRNMVTKSREGLTKIQGTVTLKHQEVDKLRASVQGSQDREAVSNQLLDSLRSLAMAENEKTTLETEIHTVLSVVRDIDQGARPHNFKSTNFVAPTTCGYCSKSIWGLAGGKGFVCTECGYTCHAKCQMKAPQDCTGVNPKLEAKKSKKKKKGGKDGEEEDADSVNGNMSLRRSSTNSSVTPSIITTTSLASPTSPGQRTSSLSAAPRSNASTRHIAQAPPPSKYLNSPPPAAAAATNGGGSGGQKAKVLFKYDASSAGELSVKPSDVLTVVEPDDGSGWIVARVGRDEGLVPASYVEVQSTDTAPKKGPPVAPRRGTKKSDKKYVRALYDYDAGSELELTIREGDVLAVVAEDKGDGWTEVELKGKVGSVPSNYVEVVDK